MKHKKKKFTQILIGLDFLGSWLIAAGLVLLFFTFGPVLKQEVKYQVHQVLPETRKILNPPNTDFAIVIPKIEAVAPVIANVNPYDETKYLPALRSGVAHASGTSVPGGSGNVYLFAHSTDAFYNVGRYNAVFYLIGKLEHGDEINVYYQNHKYLYIVEEKKVVPANAVNYLEDNSNLEKTLTLQTCYPPGTTLKRLIVVASLKGVN